MPPPATAAIPSAASAIGRPILARGRIESDLADLAFTEIPFPHILIRSSWVPLPKLASQSRVGLPTSFAAAAVIAGDPRMNAILTLAAADGHFAGAASGSADRNMWPRNGMQTGAAASGVPEAAAPVSVGFGPGLLSGRVVDGVVVAAAAVLRRRRLAPSWPGVGGCRLLR